MELDRLEFEFQVNLLTHYVNLGKYFASLNLNFYTHKLGIIAYTVVSLKFNVICKISSKVFGKENA